MQRAEQLEEQRGPILAAPLNYHRAVTVLARTVDG